MTRLSINKPFKHSPHINPQFENHTHEGGLHGMVMRVAVLSSGGKDSAAALWWAHCKGWTIDCLVTVSVTGEDSPMFQIPGTELVQQQAELADLEWVNVHTSGETPQDIVDLESALKDREIDGFVSGALRSDYQKSRLERMAERLNVVSWTPLWHQDGDHHLSGMVANGFEIMVTSVSCEGLDESWLGTLLNEDKLTELRHLANKYRFHIEGEGGEYETLVISGPHMNNSLDVEYTTHWDGVRGHLEFH